MTTAHGHKETICTTEQELKDTVKEIKTKAAKGSMIVGKTASGERVLITNNKESQATIEKILQERNDEFQKFMSMPSIVRG
jgi:uncharacterized protein YdbL (DUF1318 family)